MPWSWNDGACGPFVGGSARSKLRCPGFLRAVGARRYCACRRRYDPDGRLRPFLGTDAPAPHPSAPGWHAPGELPGAAECPSPRWQPDDQAIQIILANFEVAADETISPRLSFEKHMQIVRAMWEFNTYDYYRQVRCPVLLLPARPAEPHLPAEAEYLAYKESGVEQALQLIPKVQVHWMLDTVHDIPLRFSCRSRFPPGGICPIQQECLMNFIENTRFYWLVAGVYPGDGRLGMFSSSQRSRMRHQRLPVRRCA